MGKKIPELGKNYAFLDWEWGRNSALQERAKILCPITTTGGGLPDPPLPSTV